MAAILFDADGILLDSMRRYRSAWVRWGRGHGIPIEEIWAIAPGRRPSDILSMVAPDLTLDVELAKFMGLLRQELAHVRAMPGAKALLHRLQEGCWAIVTSGYRSHLQRALVVADLPVPAVLVTAEDVVRGKPAPDCYLLAAERLGVDATRCTVVEDAPAGIAAARAAGMRCVAVAASHHKSSLSEADHVFTSLQEASGLLLNLVLNPRAGLVRKT
jgi:sugar-phosphatase